jgi:FkbH-like protein
VFEFEAGSSALQQEMDEAALAALADPDARITAVSLFNWEEHCTECALPACYTTCDLYEARPDGRCRRFVDGIRPFDTTGSDGGRFVQISFKRWAMLFAYANLHLVPLQRAASFERTTYWLGRFASVFPDSWISIAGRRGPVKRLVRRFKDRLTRDGAFADSRHNLAPSYLLLQIVNPGTASVPLSLTIRRRNADDATSIPYQELLQCEPGANRFKIDYQRIAAVMGSASELKISLTPNILEARDEGMTLIFGTLAFVHDEAWPAAQAAPADTASEEKLPNVKLAVWDLDNTIWDGTLVEDGADGVVLKEGIADIVRELDSRGILLSIASKNDAEPALAQLKAFGIDEYFLFPKISWDPKPGAIAALIRDFNIGANTVAFIDDSPFEREHVASVHSGVRVYDALHYWELLDMPEFNPPRTTESSQRRYYYSRQKVRDAEQSEFGGNYLDFLKTCEIEIDVNPGSPERLERMFELITRTNQLNFSGNRYSRDELSALIDDDRYSTYCVDCRDKFGEYGLIGFGLVDNSSNRLIDMALSCRVQSKRVEHAFLGFLARRRSRGHDFLEATYRRTDRNQAAAAVFDDLGFDIEATGTENEFIYRIATDDMPEQDIVRVSWQGDRIPGLVEAQIDSA